MKGFSDESKSFMNMFLKSLTLILNSVLKTFYFEIVKVFDVGSCRDNVNGKGKFASS